MKVVGAKYNVNLFLLIEAVIVQAHLLRCTKECMGPTSCLRLFSFQGLFFSIQYFLIVFFNLSLRNPQLETRTFSFFLEILCYLFKTDGGISKTALVLLWNTHQIYRKYGFKSHHRLRPFYS